MRFDKTKSAKRITFLLEENSVKQKDLALALGIKHANIISYWTATNNNYRQPTIDQFADMADYFGVSVDYLLGLSDSKQRYPSLSDELGLSDEAVNRLLTIAHDPQGKAILTTLLESEELYSLILRLASYNGEG